MRAPFASPSSATLDLCVFLGALAESARHPNIEAVTSSDAVEAPMQNTLSNFADGVGVTGRAGSIEQA
ncbi:hypothetical protein [Brevundimonas sp. PWP3-1b1]|uniref:hypothetical protein n=1 Tax=unclassified Brevundimonas TaxID=2622653 RepID=UPI003CF4C08A